MTKVLVLYYSAYGHIEAMANAVAEGAREAGATVDIKRVPELVPPDVAKASHFKLDQAAPVAKIEDLANYDAIIVGTGTRFGRMASQMANFLDQAGGLWAKGALHGKVGGAFTSTATQHGGQETTLFSIITNLLHFGMTIVGLNYGFRPDEARRGHRRLALWRHHHHRRRRQPPAQRERTGRRALSGQGDRGDREEAAWLMRYRRLLVRDCRPIYPFGDDGYRHARTSFHGTGGAQSAAGDCAALVVPQPVPRHARPAAAARNAPNREAGLSVICDRPR